MNSKKTILAIVCVAVLWFIMDFIVHGNLLTEAYQATASLWKAPEEMSHMASMIFTVVFSAIYVLFYVSISSVKTTAQGFKFGFWYGLISGLCMMCMTIYMPIPNNIGIAWFVSSFVESMIAGALM